MTHEMALREKQLAIEHLLARRRARSSAGLSCPRIVGDYHMRPPAGRGVARAHRGARAASSSAWAA